MSINKDMCYSALFGIFLSVYAGDWAIPILLPIFGVAAWLDAKAEELQERAAAPRNPQGE